MAVSKNNPNSRKAATQKLFEGKAIKPVKYVGPHGVYMAAQFDNGDLITFSNDNTKPIPYKKIIA